MVTRYDAEARALPDLHRHSTLLAEATLIARKLNRNRTSRLGQRTAQILEALVLALDEETRQNNDLHRQVNTTNQVGGRYVRTEGTAGTEST